MKRIAVFMIGTIALVGVAMAAFAGVPPVDFQTMVATDIGSAGLPMLGFAGLIINKESLGAAFTSIKTIFNNAFAAAPSNWERTTMLIPSGSSQNDYTWLTAFPKMRKWVGDKVVKSLGAFKYSVTNDDFEATVEVDRNDIEDDNLGIYAPQAQMAGFSAKQLPDEIDADLKNAAFASECFDGQYFYDTDHPVGNGVASNKMTKALSAATRAAADASYGVARTAVLSQKDAEGRPLALIPDVLEVPPALEKTARNLVEMEKLADDTPNPYRGTATVMVNPRLTSTTAWFLHVTNMPVKPFIYQERKAPVFVSQTDMQADDVFSRKKYKFGAEARAAGAYGLWQLSHGSLGTT